MLNKLPDEALVVALYGLKFSASRLEASYKHLIEWFDSLGYHPDRSAVSGKNFRGKAGIFDRFDKRLQQSGFEGINGFSLYRLVPGGDVPVGDWCVTADVYERESCCVVGVRSSIAPSPSTSMLSIARTMILDFSPIYGIGFRREMGLGPTFYAMGGCVGLQLWGEERQKGERISKWWTLGIEQRIYEKGALRDVYPWNFVTNLQLSRPIEGIPLRRWIEEDSKRGSLSTFEGGTWLWEVQESEMPHVRSVLENAGLVFDIEGIRGP